MPPGNLRSLLGRTALAGAAALVVAGLWVALSGDGSVKARLLRALGRQEKLIAVSGEPDLVMGTFCRFTAVVPEGQAAAARKAIHEAEAALRDVDARMSVYLETSEVSRLNAAKAGSRVPLSPATMEVLRAAREYHGQTRGAFDATIRPLIELWKQAGKENRLPTAEQLAAARGASSWDRIELQEDGAVKRDGGAGVDLGGIAKKYAIDRAVEAMKNAGCRGGLVNVGGDVRCFGPRSDGGHWEIGILHPFHAKQAGILGKLRLTDRAVCTSGDYERYVEIGGRRYSHIIDPASGRPAEAAVSVTVVSATSLEGAWATALCVLGPEGLKLLPRGEGLEAMMIVGSEENHALHMTEGFAKLLAEPIQGPVVVRSASQAAPARRGN